MASTTPDLIDRSSRRWAWIAGAVLLIGWLWPEYDGTWPWQGVASGPPLVTAALIVWCAAGLAALAAARTTDVAVCARVLLIAGAAHFAGQSALFLTIGSAAYWEVSGQIALVASVVAVSVGSRLRYYFSGSQVARWLAAAGGVGVLASLTLFTGAISTRPGPLALYPPLAFSMLVLSASAVLAVINAVRWRRDADIAGLTVRIGRVLFWTSPVVLMLAPKPGLALLSMGLLLAVGLSAFLEHRCAAGALPLTESALARPHFQLIPDPPRPSPTWATVEENLELELPPDDDDRISADAPPTPEA